MLNGLDLFSGIGGLALALKPWVKTIAYCEVDRYCQATILSRIDDGIFENAPIWDDVRTLPGKSLQGQIDLVYGGPPCQDFSVAGPKLGLEGERGNMALKMVGLVADIRPTFVYLENVVGICNRGLWEILSRLTTLGYDCRWDILSARDVGAPHKRERLWLLAYSDSERLQITGNQPLTPSSGSSPIFDTSERGFQREVWLPATGELCRIPDGIRPATHRIKALGNAVVPQCAREAFCRLMGIQNPI